MLLLLLLLMLEEAAAQLLLLVTALTGNKPALEFWLAKLVVLSLEAAGVWKKVEDG